MDCDTCGSRMLLLDLEAATFSFDWELNALRRLFRLGEGSRVWLCDECGQLVPAG